MAVRYLGSGDDFRDDGREGSEAREGDETMEFMELEGRCVCPSRLLSAEAVELVWASALPFRRETEADLLCG